MERMKSYQEFMILEKFDDNIRAELLRLGVTDEDEINRHLYHAHCGSLSKYLQDTGRRFTFGMLNALFHDARDAKRRTDIKTGIIKAVHRILPMALAPFFPIVAIIGYILGSSRAEMHLDVNLLDSLTGLNSFNAGVSGASTRMAFIVLRSYLQHSNMPKTIFLEIDFHISHLKTDTIFNFTRYFCYLSNPVLYSELKKIDARFIQFKYNPFYSLPFSGINSLSPALHGWLRKTTKYDMYYRNGFFENRVNDHYDHFDVKKFTGFIHPETKQYLDSFLVFSKMA